MIITKDDYTVDEKGCWIWKWGKQNNGYGKVRDGRNYTTAHRLMYRQTYGEPALDLQVMHSCGVRSCVNPDHLNVGNQSDNEADKKAHGTDNYYFQYCKRRNGRPLTKEDA